MTTVRRSTSSWSEFAGDDEAAVELLRRYGPALRLEIRLRLRDARLRRLLEPADVCQSVLKSFFVRVAVGQFEPRQPEEAAGAAPDDGAEQGCL